MSSIVCSLFGSRFLSGHAALAASDTNHTHMPNHVVQYMIYVDLYACASACTSTMSCMWDMLRLCSNCSESSNMCRRSTSRMSTALVRFMQTQSCRPRHPNGESFQNIRSVRQVAVSLQNFLHCVMADEYLPQIVFTVEVTAARREAEPLHVSQARSTETVKETAARREADRLRTSSACTGETAGEAAAIRVEDQRQMTAARDSERLGPVDNVGDDKWTCTQTRWLGIWEVLHI